MGSRQSRVTEAPADDSLTLHPIGVAHTAHRDRHSAPRQAAAARGQSGEIRLFETAEFQHALADLESFSHLWVIFWFHLNRHFRPKVAPPRSDKKRGLFATRSPYRPNPIGLSLVGLERIEGHTLYVSDMDLLDGTPVLDLKPYLPYADIAPNANSGWLEQADPIAECEVHFSPHAAEQLSFLESLGCDFVRPQAESVLRLGFAPHPYRRIRPDRDGFVLAVKDFRLRFVVADSIATVVEVFSGYKRKALDDQQAMARAETPLAVHRALAAKYKRL